MENDPTTKPTDWSLICLVSDAAGQKFSLIVAQFWFTDWSWTWNDLKGSSSRADWSFFISQIFCLEYAMNAKLFLAVVHR